MMVGLPANFLSSSFRAFEIIVTTCLSDPGIARREKASVNDGARAGIELAYVVK